MIALLLLGAAAGAIIASPIVWRAAVATRTYRDARATTRTARKLWRQVPRDWGRVGSAAGGVFIIGLLVVSYWIGKS